MSVNKPRDRPTVPEVLPLVAKLYAMEGGGCGGPLHCVLDDGNIEDGHLTAFFSDDGSDELRALCNEILEKMRQMTTTQRGKIVARVY